jgi:hypothetical protein
VERGFGVQRFRKFLEQMRKQEQQRREQQSAANKAN